VEEGKEFAMIKQFVMKARRHGAGAVNGSDVGAAVWGAVGRRLQRRRVELGMGADHVAQWAGISSETYVGYEGGEPIPAALLAQVADLFGLPLIWFFQGVDEEEAEERDMEERAAPVVYQVATVEHRIAALVETFRQLDFEGQQHLLAISRALRRPSAGAMRE
jgi:transcriptional regulator with XRE-family HTH domain